MGIPYYFASLLRSHSGIVETIRKGMPLEMDVLGVDFNCLIHRYLQDDNPVQSVIDALEYITANICRSKQLFIAIDGLVPYAKMVNQRYRRMRAKESTGFDRNQISPETPYMKELEQALVAKFPLAHISKTSEPGEGEHKLFNDIKTLPENQRRSVCIYGLDADLILISLQNHKISYPYSFQLLRESAEFNDPKLAKAEFATLSIWKLLHKVPIEIEQYIALSILCFGNDFMPNLALFSLREDGYDRALQTYENAGKPNLLTSEGRRKFFENIANKEFEILRERVQLRKRPEEKAIFGRDDKLITKKFNLHYLDGVENIEQVVEAYWKTFQWTLHYFVNNKPLNWYWVYPYSEAPFITDILKYNEAKPMRESKCTYTVKKQLSFILPAYSMNVKPSYPDEIYTQTRHPWMKKYDWETKPFISLPWNPKYELTTVQKL